MSLSKSEQAAQEERIKYARAWNQTMQSIWREKITLLGAVDTGALLHSIGAESSMSANSDFSELQFSNSFLRYGIYVERGTGRNTWRGNPGDIGRDNHRKKRPWFSPKFWYSSMRIKEFMEENIGEQFKGIMISTLND